MEKKDYPPSPPAGGFGGQHAVNTLRKLQLHVMKKELRYGARL